MSIPHNQQHENHIKTLEHQPSLDLSLPESLVVHLYPHLPARRHRNTLSTCLFVVQLFRVLGNKTRASVLLGMYLVRPFARDEIPIGTVIHVGITLRNISAATEPDPQRSV